MGFDLTRRPTGLLAILGWLLLSAGAAPAAPVGWDQDDFIISGAPNFPQYIGIFDHDFTFKGYLETNFLGVQGMDFDMQGNLVAIASLSTHPEVRVYSPNGARIGGFTSNNSMLQYTGDIKVAPDGNYLLGSYTSGVQVYTPQGTFVAQYGNGDSRSVAVVPGNKVWSGGGATFVNIFDLDSGAQVGSFTLDHQRTAYSMQYSPSTQTVLMADLDLGSAFERDLSGTRLRRFEVPAAGVSCYSVTRGPNNDVFATSGSDPDVTEWLPDATLVHTINVYPVQIGAVRILWTGLVPEPSTAAMAIISAAAIFARRRR